MSGYRGNPALWNGRIERQQARDAAQEAERQAGEAALAHFLELEREATGLITPPTRRKREPAAMPDVIEAPAEPVSEKE